MRRRLLDFSNYEKALNQLKKHYNFAVNEQNPDLCFAFKTATIQSFEYSFELAVKMLKRFLRELVASNEEVDLMSFNSLIRTAAQFNLIDNPESWFNYRDKRNITSHAYNEDKSTEVFKVVPDFINDTESLLIKLKAKNQ